MSYRQATLAILLAIVCAVGAFSQTPSDSAPIHVSDLRSRPVIGDLGVPLGTAVKVKAEIVAGRDLGLGKHVWNGLYLLRVGEVDGVKLQMPVMAPFEVRFPHKVKLARSTYALYELKNGKKPQVMTPQETSSLEQGYVGKSLDLVVYEYGSFWGGPRNRPDGYPLVGEPGFHFESSLLVLTELN